MRLIVGLGNPGRRYRATRHNIGWDVLDALARAHGIAVTTDEGWAVVGRGALGGHRVLLARPETYVNASGVAVSDLRRRHRVPLDHLIVIVDDMDLPVGSIRMREKGSHGGHNGLRSIVEALGTTALARLRVGIGRPSAGEDPAEYVLQRPPVDERALLDDAVARAAEGVALWVTEGIQAAMSLCNQKRETTATDRRWI